MGIILKCIFFLIVFLAVACGELFVIDFLSDKYLLLGALALGLSFVGWGFFIPSSGDSDPAGNAMEQGFIVILNSAISIVLTIVYFCLVKFSLVKLSNIMIVVAVLFFIEILYIVTRTYTRERREERWRKMADNN